MPRNEFNWTPAGRSKGRDLTRRGLLGAAAVITGAGIADFLHRSATHSPAKVAGNTSPQLTTHTVTGNEPRVVPSKLSRSHAAPTPTSHGDPPAHHGHGHHGGTVPDTHGRPGEIDHLRTLDRVQLPPAKTRVRTKPVFYIDDLIHDAPKHAIALTVDDGPDPEYTPKVLRLLDKYRMQASFCVVGAHAEAYPKLIRDIHRAGHVIVNHTFTHVQPFNRQSESRIVGEITRTQRTLEKVAKVTPQLFRAPGGAWSPFIFKAVAAYDLIPLDWDVDPVDWSLPGTRKIERAMLRGRPNDIVLCHDGGGNRTETVRALRHVLPEWKHRGYITIPLIVPSKDLNNPPPSSPPPTQSPIVTPSTNPSDTTGATPSP